MRLRDAYADLVLGASCLGCGAPGRLVCERCRAGLPRTAYDTRPEPCPAGLARTVAAAPYDDLVRAMIVGLKEDQLLGLRAPLGELLATSVGLLAAGADAGATLVLVPVPSRPSSVRSRGLDSTRAVTERAARVLRAQGRPAVVAPVLRTRAGLRDQAGLDARERATNLDGAFACPADRLRRLTRTAPRGHVIVCDDVITTGATAREAQRALAQVGLPVTGVAAVAATVRRSLRVAGRSALS